MLVGGSKHPESWPAEQTEPFRGCPGRACPPAPDSVCPPPCDDVGFDEQREVRGL